MANTPSWNKINLNTVNWQALRARRSVGGVFMLPNPLWALDLSNAWQPSLIKLPKIAQATQQKVAACVALCLKSSRTSASTLHDCVLHCL